MPTTSNFGWTTPADTDLVKDGAAAIRTLGNGIDTSLVDLKGGTTGQVLSKASNTDLDYTWVTTDDANAIQNAIVDAKGDLIAASAADTPARLAVGNNGETLVADSSASTGLRWNPNMGSSRNRLINSDFRINQRAFTSTTASATFTYDRWQTRATDGTTTFTANTFTPGSAPSAVVEGLNYLTIQSTGQTLASARSAILQKIEDVRTFAGQTATISFYAKANSGTPSVAANVGQIFGTGGSATVDVAGQKTAITTSWARYSFTFTIPSVSGKTITSDSGLWVFLYTSAGSDFASQTASLGIQTTTIDLWGIQIELGSVATAYNTATGTLAGELAACQRYYQKSFNQATALGTATSVGSVGMAAVATTANANIIPVRFPVVMRGTPTITLYSPGTGATGKIQNVSSASDVNATDLGTGESGFAIYVTGAPGGAVGYWLAGQYQAVIEL